MNILIFYLLLPSRVDVNRFDVWPVPFLFLLCTPLPGQKNLAPTSSSPGYLWHLQQVSHSMRSRHVFILLCRGTPNLCYFTFISISGVQTYLYASVRLFLDNLLCIFHLEDIFETRCHKENATSGHGDFSSHRNYELPRKTDRKYKSIRKKQQDSKHVKQLVDGCQSW